MEKKRYGIQIGQNGDLSVSASGALLGDTMAQNEYIILMSQKGDIKERPLMGAGISDMVGSHETASMKRQIRDALKEDGMTVSAIDMDGGTIKRLEASYR